MNMMIREMEIRAEGRETERELAVKSLTEKMGWTEQQAREALGYEEKISGAPKAGAAAV